MLAKAVIDHIFVQRAKKKALADSHTSDTDDEDYVEDGEDDSEESDEEEDEDEDAEEEESSDETSEDDMHIFPKAKTVIADTTGQPKRVYPEIEPDYDSDSSTEDVRTFIEYITFPCAMLTVGICCADT